MTELSKNSGKRVPTWILILLSVLVIGGLALLMVFEDQMANSANWIIYAILIPIYFALQIIVEALIEGIWGANHILSRVIAIAVVLGFYLIWFVKYE